MKPLPPFAPRARQRFPIVDVCFQDDFRDWGGSFRPGSDDDSPARRFSRFNCELLRESRRERQREMFVFALVMVIAAWPVLWMIWNLVDALLHGLLLPT